MVVVLSCWKEIIVSFRFYFFLRCANIRIFFVMVSRLISGVQLKFSHRHADVKEASPEK